MRLIGIKRETYVKTRLIGKILRIIIGQGLVVLQVDQPS